jgi:hypothetical protein
LESFIVLFFDVWVIPTQIQTAEDGNLGCTRLPSFWRAGITWQSLSGSLGGPKKMASTTGSAQDMKYPLAI